MGGRVKVERGLEGERKKKMALLFLALGDIYVFFRGVR